VETGLLTEAAADAFVLIEMGRFVETDLDGFASEGAGAVTRATGPPVVAEAELFVHMGLAHINGFDEACTAHVDRLECSGRTDLGALAAKDATAFSRRDVRGERVADALGKAMKFDAAVRAGGGTFKATGASVFELFLGQSPRRPER